MHPRSRSNWCRSPRLSQLQPASIGSFYVALFPLSIGYERMAKVALQINAKITTGQFLTKAQMRDKATAGHRIDALFDRVEELAVTHKYDQNHPNGQRPTDDITMAITAVLTEFADGGRYNHLNSLGSPDAPVPSAEEQWDSEVMRRIAATHLTARRKSKIARNAAMWDTQATPTSAPSRSIRMLMEASTQPQECWHSGPVSTRRSLPTPGCMHCDRAAGWPAFSTN